MIMKTMATMTTVELSSLAAGDGGGGDVPSPPPAPPPRTSPTQSVLILRGSPHPRLLSPWCRPAPCRFDANRFQQWCAARKFLKEIEGVDDQGPHEGSCSLRVEAQGQENTHPELPCIIVLKFRRQGKVGGPCAIRGVSRWSSSPS